MEMATTRHSAAERRDDLVEAALIEFAEHGYEGTSTEDIARRAGISQPYLFRLFGTKKELFKASAARCMRETLEMFQRAAEGKRGEEALHAMGAAYIEELLTGDRVRLRAQMQAYVACDDPEICAVVRNGFGDLVAYAQRVSDLPPEHIARFFATGMLLNVLASMQVTADPEPWAKTLLEGCGKDI
jgi:AcrR family transcriptional regulator